ADLRARDRLARREAERDVVAPGEDLERERGRRERLDGRGAGLLHERPAARERVDEARAREAGGRGIGVAREVLDGGGLRERRRAGEEREEEERGVSHGVLLSHFRTVIE